MPTVSGITTIRMSGFDGGLNTDADEFQLDPNESPDCLNVDFGLRGAVSKRKGYTRYDDPTLTPLYRFLYRWNQRGGDDYLILVEDDEIRFGDGVAFTQQVTNWSAPTAGDDIDWHVGVVAYENVLYVSSKNGNTYKFDGTTWTEITDSNLTGTASEFPQAAHLETNYERVWAGNVFNNAVEYASRVHYSKVGEAEEWDPLDWIDVDPDDGDVITALKVFGGNLMIWKNRAVYTLSGTDENTFTLFPLDRDIGTNAPRSVASEGDRLIFFDPLTGVWQFDGAGFDKLDDKINLFLLDGINFAFSHRSAAFIWRGKYYLSVPWDASEWPNRTFVHDLRNGSWTQYDYGFASWAHRDDAVYGVTTKGTAGVFNAFTGLSDAGSSIAAYMETAWISPENEAVKQRLRRLDFAFTAIGNHDITVHLKRDFAIDPTTSQVINTDPGGAVWNAFNWNAEKWGVGLDQVLVRTTGWGRWRWRTMQLRFEESTSTGEFQLNRTLLHFSSLDRVRGEA